MAFHVDGVMVMGDTEMVVGIDAGGTKTRGLLCRVSGHRLEIVQQHTGPPGNWLGSAHPNRRMAASLTEVCRGLGFPDDGSVSAVVAAVAGAGLPGRCREVRRVLERHFPGARSEVISDAQAAYWATSNPEAVVVISGTGSVALARKDGRWLTAGGQGAVLADEGSGFWIGRKGLNAALRAGERRGPRTGLLELALRHYGIDDLKTLPARVHGPEGIDIAGVAAFSRCVFEAARDGDGEALILLERAGRELAGLAVNLLRRVGPPGNRSVYVVGGVWRGRPSVIDSFTRELWRHRGTVPVRSPLLGPAEGAALRAWSLRDRGGVHET